MVVYVVIYVVIYMVVYAVVYVVVVYMLYMWWLCMCYICGGCVRVVSTHVTVFKKSSMYRSP